VTALLQALAISRKDAESYYAKPPLITWGLLFPAVLLLAVYVKDRAGYLDVVPGIIAMTLLFGNTSMAAVVITFEKRTGTLQRLLLAPVGMPAIVFGKALSAALYGLGTSLVLTAILAAAIGLPLEQPLAFAAGLVGGAAVFSLLGLVAAAMVREVFEAMTLLNLFRFPLLFLSGVFIPLSDMPGWLKPVAYCSPLTYAVELLRFGVFGRSDFPSVWIPAAAAVAFVLGSWALAVFQCRRFLYGA